MATYLWKKYSKIVEEHYKIKETKLDRSPMAHNGEIYERLEIDSNTGKLRLREELRISSFLEGSIVYFVDNRGDEPLYKKGLADSRTSRVWVYFEYTYTIVPLKYNSVFKGSYISEVTSDNRNAYPDNSYSGDYWYEYIGIANQPPIISGDATQIGIITNDRSIRFSVSDPDNDVVTVEIKIDGIKTKDSPFVAELGETYNIPIKIADYKIGEHNVEVIATDTGGLSDSRTWYFERGNSNPTISGKDEDLGDKNSGFQIPFSINDIDLNDELTIQISLNDRVLQTINNALRNKEYIVDIEDGTVYAQELGKLNTIIIKVTDGQGGVSYRYKYFKRTNTAPIISGEDKDIGVVEKAPVVSFSAKDLENDLMTYSVYLNDKELLKDVKLEADKNIEYRLSKNEFSQLDNIKKHRIRIVVTDAQKATSIRNITFKRKLSKCWHKTIRQTDIQATKFYAFVSTLLSEGAELKVEVCNNANDEKPTWEDATVNVKQGTSYIFKNKEKTHDFWAVGLLVTILPGTSKEPSWILGAGGGFE